MRREYTTGEKVGLTVAVLFGIPLVLLGILILVWGILDYLGFPLPGI